MRKCSILGRKSKKQLENKNHTMDWAPGLIIVMFT